MENNEKTSHNILTFGKQKLPLPVESNPANDDTYVTHGNDNLYPQYLISLYAKSPQFANIVNQKAKFIGRHGMIDLGTDKPLIGKPNPSTSWELFTKQIILSNLIFNAYAVEVNFNAFGEAIQWNFISYEKVRLNKSKTKVWVCNDWSKKKDILLFDRYFSEKDYGDKATSSKVFIYDGYVPSANAGIYTLPDYYPLISNLELDIEIHKFNYANITNNFSVSTLINVYQTGDEATKSAFLKKIEDSYSGNNGKKVIVSFIPNASNAKPTEILPLTSGDWTNAYALLKENNDNTIYQGMEIINPSIFGHQATGNLSNNSELLNSFEILENTIIADKRNELEAGIREMLNLNVSFVSKPVLQPVLSDDMKKSVMTIDEIRLSVNLPVLPNNAGAVLASASVPPTTTFTLAPTKFESKDEWEKVSATDEHFEAIKHLGTDKSEFKTYEGNFSMAKLAFSDESDIAQFLIDSDLQNVTLDEIKKGIREKLGINVSLDELQNHIDEVVKTGVIAVDKSGDTLTIKKGEKLLDPVEKRTIETVYQYVKRPEMAGAEIIPTTRKFCEKIILMNKYFSLEEIQLVSRTLNYDVLIHCGGFYRVKGSTGKPNATNTKPHCRHEWKQVQVVRKPKDNL
ncbi:hypothetical protein [Pedobacter sp. MR2016-24]|uniref:hypothetical protein n=1 Tax=Pedobacter sp. MR2016-24 TaxID=2994466 RepID=UPI0022466B0E|nr:hypothetical protein [Pedobacter sp. MR2016-24]MCX2486608.1 hypothetical protein [Pedobacter sp. MR2016-24]